MFSSNTSQVSDSTLYVEDVFSTYLYTGNGSTQTITNGIDLSTYGGLVWAKARSSADNHGLYDTARGVENRLISNSTAAESTASGVTAFNANGFSLGSNSDVNGSGKTTVSWTFRKQPKFFDVVTWTGDGSTNRQIAHSLNGTVGSIFVKSTTAASGWRVYHRSVGATGALTLNSTAVVATDSSFWNNTAPTSTVFTVGDTNNFNGASYVAYLFAHNAGGFGLTGTDNVISCGSYTGNGSSTGPTITLGYEPQWIMVKRAVGGTGNWILLDNMRGIPTGSADQYLLADTADAEASLSICDLNATGFQITSTVTGLNASGSTYIYIAIRRGPMKVPTSGTSVFAVQAATGTSPSSTTFTTNFPVSLAIGKRYNVGWDWYWEDRLRGANIYINSASSTADATTTEPSFSFANNTALVIGSEGGTNTGNQLRYAFQRSPGFFDEVCYTGTGANAQTLNHNLGVAPELMFVKRRNAASIDGWIVYSKTLGTGSVLVLNTTGGDIGSNVYFGNTSPTATQFTVGYPSYSTTDVNASGSTYVAYLFATCAGVSKVGSYTGNGSSQTIDCGFTGGARFVLIKRSNTTGNWYVWDTARGMVAGTDPKLALNSTAAETNADWVYTTTGGFQIVTSDTNVNANGSTYIYLAIA